MDELSEMEDRLIAYWESESGVDEATGLLCRELTLALAKRLPAQELSLIRQTPRRFRTELAQVLRQIDEERRQVRSFTLGKPPSPPSPAPPIQGTTTPSPPPPLETRGTVSGASQSIQGNGNFAFNATEVHGSINIRPALRTAVGGDSTPPNQATVQNPAPVRILFLGANPSDSMRLRLDAEVREIDQTLIAAKFGSRFELCQKWAVRPSELQAHLLRHRPQIVHFSGHGSREKAIFLEGQDGTSRPVAADLLARLLGQFRSHLRCVVLNACYSQDQALAIAEKIDCVIGMSTAVLDRVAIRFSASLYQAIAFGYDLRAAFDLSCSDIEIGELHQEAVPQLVALHRDPREIVFIPETQSGWP